MLAAAGRFLDPRGVTARRPYFLTGVGLFAVKFGIDRTLARQFGHAWTPLNYLLWPTRGDFLLRDMPPADRQLALTLLAVSVPFILVGLSLTLRRLRDAGLPLALAVLWFLPLVNLLLIAGLCLLPTRPPVLQPAPETRLARRARAAHWRVAGGSSAGAFALACGLSAAVTAGMVYLAANSLESYGFGVFVAAPFAQGWLAAVLYGLPRRRTAADCVAVALTALALSAVVLFLLAMEGAICILMAAPIGIGLGTLGGLVGFAVQSRPWANDHVPALTLGLLVLLPALIAAEAAVPREPAVRAVVTAVEVDAPPSRVWELVVAFPPLPPPTDPLFRTGLAYPLRAAINGRGVGAVRHCVFSTGPFVEPITVWDEPRCLAFDVSDQPAPMAELSPFHVHPPHLDNFLVSRRGQFRLEPLPGGRTRLEGTTWYTNRMWPADYWGVWSDAIIGRIHRRVLDHVRELAERDTP